MKNFVNFLSDTMVMFALISIMSAAFLATMALSPIDFSSSLLAQNSQQQSVLGEADVHKLQFTDKFQTHDYFSVTQIKTDQTYNAHILLGPVSQGKIEKDIVEIKNLSNKSRSFTVVLKSAIDESSSLKYGFEIEGVTTSITQSENEPTIITLDPNDSTTLKLIVDVDQKINYKVDFALVVKGE